MNGDAQSKLSDEIMEDARRRAERNVAHARAEADKLKAAAEAEAKAVADKLLQEAEARAAQKERMILAGVTQQVAHARLRKRERLMVAAFDAATASLAKLPPEQYRESVIKLAVEAACGMEAPKVLVRVTAGQWRQLRRRGAGRRDRRKASPGRSADRGDRRAGSGRIGRAGVPRRVCRWQHGLGQYLCGADAAAAG